MILITFAFLFSISLSSVQAFTLKSNELNGKATPEQMFHSLGCTGPNQSLHLAWVNPLADTKCFGVTVFDECLPTGSGWWPGLNFNMPAFVT